MITRNTVSSAFLLGSLLASALTVSCSGGGGAKGDDAITPGAAGQSAVGAAGQSTRTPGAAGNAGAAPAEGGSGACVPAGADEPDDAFVDSNCDGIDGDKSQAIFVGPNGDDEQPGTLEQPVRSIGKAIELAAPAGKAVYACNGTYSEAITISGTAVSIYGGYDCAAGWARTRTGRAQVESPATRALTISQVTDKMVIDRVNFRASSATVPGTSSIAAFIVASQNVALVHVDLTAGDGAAGVPGGSVPGYTYTDAELKVFTGDPGSSAAAVACDRRKPASGCDSGYPGGRVGGGQGYQPPRCRSNDAPTYGGSGGDGGNLYRGLAATCGGCGIPVCSQDGDLALAGKDGGPGGPATLGFGSVGLDGYSPTNQGADGTPGENGQAGRGGCGQSSTMVPYPGISDVISASSKYYIVGGGGGQGGAGGCGGWPGEGGGGGGASIALLVIDSTVSLARGTYTTRRGGAGALGSAGGPGGAGAPGGAGGLGSCECDPDWTPGCGTASVCPRTAAQAGWSGGRGGKGGTGGPGAGGPSIPLVIVGQPPTLDAIQPEPGPGGLGAIDSLGRLGATGDSQDRKDLSGSSVNTPDAGTQPPSAQ